MNNWLRPYLRVVATAAPAVAILLPIAAFAQNVATASTPDLNAVVQPIFAVIGTVIAGLLGIYIPKTFAAFQTRIGIQLTDQQRATVLGAVKTAAGMIETMLDQGSMRLAHVDVTNPAVRAEAVSAINSVPDAASALSMTVDGTARMIVGAVNTRLHGFGTGVAMAAMPRGASR